MSEQLFYFRPGEEVRMLARCQVGISATGRCGVTLTYPIRGYPWRRNIVKTLAFDLPASEAMTLLTEVRALKADHPAECLSDDQLWSDSTEPGNGVTRDIATNTLCYTIGLSGPDGRGWREYFSMRETSAALLGSSVYQTITRMIAPYERCEGIPTDGLTSA